MLRRRDEDETFFTVVVTISIFWTVSGLAQPSVYIADTVSDNVSVLGCPGGDITDTIPVGDTTFGTVISPDGDLLYVTNIFDNNVSVIETATNTVVDTITVGTFPNAAAITPVNH